MTPKKNVLKIKNTIPAIISSFLLTKLSSTHPLNLILKIYYSMKASALNPMIHKKVALKATEILINN